MFNHRHSLQTLQKALLEKSYSLAFYLENGKPLYQFSERNMDNQLTICGFAYSAKDAADITNKLLKLI